jgi:hypothetical protein
MHSYLTADHRACCAVVHIITARPTTPTYSSIIIAAPARHSKRLLHAFRTLTRHARCCLQVPYSLTTRAATTLTRPHTRPRSNSIFTLTPTVHLVPEAPQAHLRSIVARGH